jgi:hypothetical protein
MTTPAKAAQTEREPRKIKLTAQQKQRQASIRSLVSYVSRYETQSECLNYSDETFIDDFLYGLGVAFDGKHSFAQGYEVWKQKLREHLGSVT